MRRLAAALAAVLLAGAAPPASHAITITINGEALALQPPPRMLGGRLFVPVRRTIEALGLDFNRDGRRIWMHAGARVATLTLGSKSAQLDGETIALGAAPVELADTLYAPLTFFTDVLGAQASFDHRTSVVMIVASEMGRTGAGVVTNGATIERLGTVSAVDLNSDPPTVTLTYNATVKTVPIARNAVVELHDVVANVSVPGELGSIRPGDFARITMQKNGHVLRVEDAYGSIAGTIAAAVSDEFVLDDGAVVTPNRGTQISLNGASAQLSDLRAGDRAVVRYNVETNEIRQILATRRNAGTQSSSAVAIHRVRLSNDRPLRAGETLRVSIEATPHAAVTYDIGSYVSDLATSEVAPGRYEASYVIPRGASFDDVPIIAHVSQGGASASLSSEQSLSAASVPPGVVDVAPANGAVVNSHRPAIYATFARGAVPVNPSSVMLRVNGRDVTASCVRNEGFIDYTPSVDFPQGRVEVAVTVADRAGNKMTKTWTFTVKYR